MTKKTSNGKNSGKYFEGKSIDTLRAIFPSNSIHPEKQIPTTYGGFRKVDIGINNPGEYDYIVIECKDEERVTGVGAVGQAQDIMKDVGAGRCAVITNNRASKNALKKSLAQDVDVFNLIDPEDESIRPKLTVSVLTEFTWLAQYTYECEFAGQIMHISFPPNETILSEDGTVHQLASRLWNESKLSIEPGKHEYVHESFNMVSAVKYGLISAPADDIKFSYEVVAKKFLCNIPLAKGVGLYDIKNAQFIAASDEVAVGPMSIDAIARSENETAKTAEELRAAFIGNLKHIMSPT